eukprot:14846880-Ditylum_brightwellii.AAC.1
MEEDKPHKTSVSNTSTNGKYFEKLAGYSLEKLLTFVLSKEAFRESFKTPMDDIVERYGRMDIDRRPMEVVPWPTDNEVKVLTDLLKDFIDNGFDTAI